MNTIIATQINKIIANGTISDSDKILNIKSLINENLSSDDSIFPSKSIKH
jgi:hypothetical protein